MHISKLSSAFLALMAAAAPTYAAETLMVVEHPDNEQTIPMTPNKDSLGDLIVFHNSIFDADNRMKVGRDEGYCVRVFVATSYACFWTLFLTEGQITVEGPYTDKGDSVLSITGGSGKYAGARGSMILHPRDAKNLSYDFRYQLL